MGQITSQSASFIASAISSELKAIEMPLPPSSEPAHL